MNIWEAIILGIIQGITEFLPISSSGHLVIGKHLLGVELSENIIFEVFVHFGTLIAIIAVFYRKIWTLIKSPFLFHKQDKTKSNLKLIGFIVLASVPAGVIGIFFDDYIEQAFSNVTLVSFALICTGVILYITRFISDHTHNIKLQNSFLIGVAQAFAIIPGISRSGSTIATGLFQKVDKNEAVEFSFLLAIPAIAGATLLKTKELIESFPGWISFFPTIVGTVVATLSGYIAIRWLIKIINKGKLNYFAYYCWVVGSIGIIVHILKRFQ